MPNMWSKIGLSTPLSRGMMVLVVMSLLMTTLGCNAARLGKPAEASRVQQLSKLVYPKDSKRGQDLDILVIRRGGSISFINRTPRVFHDVEIWLNQQYVNALPRIDIGDTASNSDYNLAAFINKHGQIYPVGGILTPDKDMQLLVAELFDPATGLRHHLLVQRR